jgi:hypothetical protein
LSFSSPLRGLKTEDQMTLLTEQLCFNPQIEGISMAVGLLGFCGIGGKLMMGKVTLSEQKRKTL